VIAFLDVDLIKNETAWLLGARQFHFISRLSI